MYLIPYNAISKIRNIIRRLETNVTDVLSFDYIMCCNCLEWHLCKSQILVNYSRLGHNYLLQKYLQVYHRFWFQNTLRYLALCTIILHG